jgi:hypothetical protein
MRSVELRGALYQGSSHAVSARRVAQAITHAKESQRVRVSKQEVVAAKSELVYQARSAVETCEVRNRWLALLQCRDGEKCANTLVR